MSRNRGFTLIEMLLVVAVIAVLSSVVLTSWGPVRDKAKDSRIIQEINQIRSFAETLYNGTYDALEAVTPGVTINSPDLKFLVDDIAVQGGEVNIIKSSQQSAKAYSAYSKLNTRVGTEPDIRIQYYCIDSAGRSVFTTEEPTASICPS